MDPLVRVVVILAVTLSAPVVDAQQSTSGSSSSSWGSGSESSPPTSGSSGSRGSSSFGSMWGSSSNVTFDSSSGDDSSGVNACYGPKSEDKCYALLYCIWTATASCDDWFNYPFEDSGPVNIYGVRVTPSSPAAGFPLHIFVYFNGLVTLAAQVGFIADIAACVPGATLGTALGYIDTYNLIAEADLVVPTAGSYHFCLATSTSAQVYSATTKITVASPVVKNFTSSPALLFRGDIAAFSFTGSYLTPHDAVALIQPDAQGCPSADSPTFSPVALATADGSYAEMSMTVNTVGELRVCYSTSAGSVFQVGTIVSLEQVATVPANILATSTQLPRVLGGLQIAESNIRYCASVKNTSVTNSMQANALPSRYAGGPFIHPVSFRLQYGNLFSAYALSDTCIIAIKPLAQQGFSYQSVQVEFTSVSIDSTDEVRIFTPGGAIPGCQSYTAKACPLWCNANSTACLNPTSKLRCPTEISGYTYVGRMTYDTFVSGVTTISTTYKEGLILAVCTDATVGSGSGFAVKYTTTRGYCSNDCVDQNGKRHGTCRLIGLSFKCVCQSGYFGEDCSSKVTCKGSEAITGTTGTRPVWFDGPESCGFQITATADHTDPSFSRTGIGLDFSNITLGPNCTQSRIIVRSTSSSGKLIKSFCASDFTSTVNRLLLQTTSAYVQFDGVLNDAVSINYASVSLVCPGGSTVCGNRGDCVDAKFNGPAIMPRYSKRCRCQHPFAPPSTYASCTVCEFGSNQLSFPYCTNLRVCSSNLDCNQGSCSQGRCVCSAGYAGYACDVPTEVYTTDAITTGSALLRMPLDNGAANIVRSGSSDAALMPCQLPGAPSPCVLAPRSVGSRDRVDNKSTSGTLFNTLVVDNTYRDFIQLNNASGAGLDVTLPATVTSWVKLTPSSQGFLIAKIDSAFYATGEPPALLRALNDIKSRTMPDDELLLGGDDLAVYFGIYLNAPQQRIDLITTAGKKSGGRENWHAVRHFRIGSGSHLFDGNWHFVAVVFRNRLDGKLEAVVFVDGYTELGSVTYAQCIPFAPKGFQSRVNSTDADLTMSENGGSIHVGYHLQASISDVRIYGRELSQSSIIAIGGHDFDYNLIVPTTILLALAGICAVTLFICLILGVVGIIRRRNTAPPATPDANETSQRKYEDRTIVMVEPRTDANTLHTPQDAEIDDEHHNANDRVRKGVILATAVNAAHNARDSEVLAAGSQQEAGGAEFSLQTLLTFVSHLGHQLSLRISIAMGAWQIVAVWLQTLSFPTGFRSYGGKAASLFSLDFANASIPIDFVTMLYAKIVIAVGFFLVLVVLYATEKTKSREEMLELHAKHLQERKEAEERDEKWSPKLTARQSLAAVALLIVTTMYMPVTQSSVAVVFCHPSVQCIFDCYNESAHFTAIGWSVVGLVFITLLTPVAALSIVSFAKKQFEILSANEIANDDLLDDVWTQHVIVDGSPYADLYLGVEYKWAHFQAIVMIVKTFMCLASLALAEQSVQQLGAIVAIQALFSLFTFITTPFTLQACDAMMSVSQLYVLIILGLSCLNRVNEQYPIGTVANAASGAAIVLQLICLVVPTKR